MAIFINDNEMRVEYVAAASETTFVVNWTFLQDRDLLVFQEELILTLGVDYTVTGAGNTGGGDVILTVGASANDSVIIVGDVVIDQTVDFTTKANFTGETIQTQFNKLTMIDQQFNTSLNQRGLLYNEFTDLKLNRADNILPSLIANQFWQMNSTATGIFAAELEIDPGANTLRSELISTQSGSDGALIIGYSSPVLGPIFIHDYLVRLESKTIGADGASIIGYNDSSDQTEKTVKIKLDELSVSTTSETFTNLIFGGDFSTNPFQRGSAFDPLTASDTFPADRFRWVQAGSVILKSSVETATPPTVAEAGIFVNKYLRFEVTTGAGLAAGDFLSVLQSIEGFNWTRIAQREFSASFWVRSSIIGTFAVGLKNIDSTESYVRNYTIDVANTWEKKTFLIKPSPAAGTWDYENGIGLQVIFTLGAGATFQTATLDSWIAGNFFASTTQTNFGATAANTFDISLVQVEPGDAPTDFEVRTVGQELSLCQRYFAKSYNISDAPGSITINGSLFTVIQGIGLGDSAADMIFTAPVNLLRQPLTPDIKIFSTITGDVGMVTADGNKDLPAIARQGGEHTTIVGSTALFGQGETISAHITIDVEL